LVVEKPEDPKETKEARRKRKVVILAFSQVPGLILDFTQAEAKAASDVRPAFRYSSVLFQPLPKADAELAAISAPSSKKRRRSSRHAASMDAEQDFAIPSGFLPFIPVS
jgi:hypothetical protein